MKTETTTNLKLSIRDRYILAEPTIRAGLTGATFIVALVLISRLLAPPTPAPVVVTLKPVILVQTAQPQPTWTPAPTSEPLVQYIILPTPEPEVIYVQAPAEAAQEAPQQAEAPVVEVQAAPTPEVLCDERCLNIRDHYVEPPHLQTFAVLPGDDISPSVLREAMDK